MKGGGICKNQKRSEEGGEQSLLERHRFGLGGRGKREEERGLRSRKREKGGSLEETLPERGVFRNTERKGKRTLSREGEY